MKYEAKNFENLLGLPGFSDNLLKNHFVLYQGYVANTNKLSDQLAAYLKEDKVAVPEYAEIKRRLGWEYDGMRLHELYFENIGKNTSPISAGSELAAKINETFGSLENWQKDFRATGAMRGIGWAVLYLDPLSKNIFNIWINEHDTGHLAGAKPLLVMDVFEHAYLLDYGIKKADYIEAFLKVIDWAEAEKRFNK
jgi:Fe-Mn family superoxide dismutase